MTTVAFSNFFMCEDSHGYSDRNITLQIEEVLVDVINGRTPKYRSLLPTGKKVIDILKSKGMNIGDDAKHYGSAKIKGELSSSYIEKMRQLFPDYNPISANRTPKTDLYTSTQRISLKCNAGWLFAHQMIDTSICFHSIIDNAKELKDEITSRVTKAVSGILEYEKGLSKADKSRVLQDAIAKEFTSTFDNIALKKAFIKNGVTGTFKFGDSLAACNTMLVIKYTQQKMSSEKALRNPDFISDATYMTPVSNDAWINKMTSIIQPSFMVQPSGKIRFDVKQKNASADVTSESMYLEGVMSDIGNYIGKGYNAVKKYIEKLVNFIIVTLRESFTKFMTLFGLDVDVNLNNEFILPTLY